MIYLLIQTGNTSVRAQTLSSSEDLHPRAPPQTKTRTIYLRKPLRISKLAKGWQRDGKGRAKGRQGAAKGWQKGGKGVAKGLQKGGKGVANGWQRET